MIKNFDKFKMIKESTIPMIHFEEILNNVKAANKGHIAALSSQYKISDKYIDISSKTTHTFRVNDLTGDILGTSRVILNVICLHETDIDIIRQNLVKVAVEEFYKALPETLNIFSIDLRPSTFINRQELEFVFDGAVTKDEALRKISEINKTDYVGVRDGYHIWQENNK